jgi:asparagine synthase (glutamine-hydrolysing)
MCGIVGIADLSGRRSDFAAIGRAMRDMLTHRGPDEAGERTDGPVWLGSRRLSIIDVASGHMPMGNEDGTVWTVYNGEIYNFPALRAELEAAGHRFRTRCDTEIVVHAFEEWGTACVERFNGMFALAVHDVANRRLFLARDRMGEKPLHYVWDGGLFLFASEIKALTRHPDVSRRIDPLAVSKYLTFEYVPAPHAIFQGVRKLEPGHWLLLDLEDRRLEIRQYWDLPLLDDAPQYKPEEDYAAELLERLSEATRIRLVSDVPIGVFLSGGVDSSSVAALAARHHSGPLEAFTIGFSDPSFDETNWSEIAARATGVVHHVERCELERVLPEIPEIMATLDEPLGDASYVPTFLLSRFARKRLTVALSGDGGDDILAGYPTFPSLKLIRYYSIFPSELRQVINRVAGWLPVSLTNISFDFKIKQMLRGAGVANEIMFLHWMGSFTEGEKRGLLGPAVRTAIGNANAFEDVLDHIKRSNLRNDLERMLYLCAKLYLQDDILVKVDRASMANSLEVRSPFLDHTLVEFVSRVPTRLKLNRLTTKYVLKRAVSGLLPRQLVRRAKKGFGLPVGRWINDGLGPLVDAALAPERLRREELFDADFVSDLLAAHRAGRRDNRKLLWTLFAFQTWRERWAA